MATRATYQINATTFYCHWDGYPTGAAQRFANMIAALTVPETGDRKFEPIQCRRGGFEFAFIRGNLDAEPTEGHDAHGDTEFQYTLKVEENGAALMTVASVAHDWKRDTATTRTLFTGDLADWLNQRRGELERDLRRWYIKRPVAGRTAETARVDALAAIPVIRRIEESREYGARSQVYYATEEARRTIASELERHGEAFKPDNVNRGIYLKRAAEWKQIEVAA